MKMTTIVENRPLNKYYPDPHFARMPVLYLEFLENKNKIKKNLLTKSYIPSSTYEDYNFKKHSSLEKKHSPENEQIYETEFNTPQNQDSTQNFEDSDYEKENEELISSSTPSHSMLPPLAAPKVLPSSMPTHSMLPSSAASVMLPPSAQDENVNIADYVSKRLDNVLGLDDLQSDEIKEEKQPLFKNDFNAPTLQELQKQKKIVIEKEFKYTEDDEQTQKERNAMYFKLEVLRRMHPNMPVPEFTPYSDPKVMKQKIEMLTEKLALNTAVDNWKRYLIIGVMVCEVVLGKLNFDMEGFAQQQITQMSTYDQLLVEIAEKNQQKVQSRWGPETRLCLMLSLNTVLFVVSKNLAKTSGFNLLGTINSMTSGLAVPQNNNMKEP